MNYKLKTERLFLRPLQQEDVEKHFELVRNNPQITEFLSWEVPQKISETQAFFESVQRGFPEKNIVWAIYYHDEFCGIINFDKIVRSFRTRRFDQARLGYWLSPEYHNNGLMTEAVDEVLKFGFSDFKLHKINVSHVSQNYASQRVIEKIGFRYIGEKQEEFFQNGQWWSHKIYEMTIGEWKKIQKLKNEI